MFLFHFQFAKLLPIIYYINFISELWCKFRSEKHVHLNYKEFEIVKLTSNIELDLLAAVFDLRSWIMCREPTFIFYSEHFGVLNVEIG